MATNVWDFINSTLDNKTQNPPAVTIPDNQKSRSPLPSISQVESKGEKYEDEAWNIIDNILNQNQPEENQNNNTQQNTNIENPVNNSKNNLSESTTPQEGIKNLAGAIGQGLEQGVNGVANVPGEVLTGVADYTNTLSNKPLETLASTPGAFGYGAMQAVRDTLQGITDIPSAIVNAYNGKEVLKNPIQLPQVGDIRDIYGTPLKEKYPGLEAAQTVGSFAPFMIPGTAVAKAGAASENIAGSIAKSAAGGAAFGAATTPGNLQNKVSGAVQVGTLGAGLHGAGYGIGKYSDLTLDRRTYRQLDKIDKQKSEITEHLNNLNDKLEYHSNLPKTAQNPKTINHLNNGIQRNKLRLKDLEEQENQLIETYQKKNPSDIQEKTENNNLPSSPVQLQGSVEQNVPSIDANRLLGQTDNSDINNQIAQEFQYGSMLKDEYDSHIQDIKDKYGNFQNFKNQAVNDFLHDKETPAVDQYRSVIALEKELNNKNIKHDNIAGIKAESLNKPEPANQSNNIENPVESEPLQGNISENKISLQQDNEPDIFQQRDEIADQKSKLLQQQTSFRANSKKFKKLQEKIDELDKQDKELLSQYDKAHTDSFLPVLQDRIEEAVKNNAIDMTELQNEIQTERVKVLESKKKDLVKKAASGEITPDEQKELFNTHKQLKDFERENSRQNEQDNLKNEQTPPVGEQNDQNLNKSENNEQARVQGITSNIKKNKEEGINQEESEKLKSAKAGNSNQSQPNIEEENGKNIKTKVNSYNTADSKAYVPPYEQTGKPSIEEPLKLKTASQTNLDEKKGDILQQLKQIESAKGVLPSLKEAARQYYTNIDLEHYNTSKNLNELTQKINNIAQKSGKRIITGNRLKEIAPFLRQKTDFPSELAKERTDLKNVWNNLTPELKKELTSYIDKAMEYHDKLWDKYKKTVGENQTHIGDIEHYLTQIWDLDKKSRPLVSNYFTTNSKFAKQRAIESYYEGIQGIKLENGEILKLKPKTLDITTIMQAHANSLINAISGKEFADYASNLKNKDGLPIVVRADQAPSNWISVDHPALKKTVFIGSETKRGEKISAELQNTLAELGIAIGRRINPRSKAMGMYRTGIEPPEIRFQRWFSNKAAAHEVGHALDEMLGLGRDFFDRHENELYALNEKRIESYMESGDYKGADYAESHEEQIAELFGFLFNDPEFTQEKAPSAMAEVLQRMSNNEKIAKLLPENFDWSRAKNLIEEKTNTLFKMGVKVHPDTAKIYRDIFEKSKNDFWTPFLKFYDVANKHQKTMNFGLSGFHGWALTEKALPLLDGKIFHVINPEQYIDAIKNGNYDIYKQDDIARDLIKHNLKLEAPQDAPRQRIDAQIGRLGRYLEKESFKDKRPEQKTALLALGRTFKGINSGGELFDKTLWAYLHNGYKLETAKRLISIELDRYKGKNLSDKDISDIKKEVCQFTNDVYGGQVWNILGLSRGAVRGWGRIFKSFDWLSSTTREFAGMLSTGKGQKFLNRKAAESEVFDKLRDFTRTIGVSSINDSEIGAAVRGRRARAFWGKSLLYWGTLYNAANIACRLWDARNNPDLYKDKKALDYTMLGNAEGKQSFIFTERQKSGKELYTREGKAYREVPELATETITKTINKLALGGTIAKVSFESYWGVDDFGKKIPGWNEKNNIEKLAITAMEMGSEFLPYTIQGVFNQYTPWHPINFFMPTSNGASFQKGVEEYKKALKGKDWDKVNKISEDLIMNNINAKKVAMSALSDQPFFDNNFDYKTYIEKQSSFAGLKKALDENNQEKAESLKKSITRKYFKNNPEKAEKAYDKYIRNLQDIEEQRKDPEGIKKIILEHLKESNQ